MSITTQARAQTRVQVRAQAGSRTRRRYEAIFKRFQGYTMIPRAVYASNLELASRFTDIAGHVVECGAWRGGMIAGLASVLGDDRKYFVFDSFEGLPDAQEIDGESALRWQADKNSPQYHDNCSAEESFAIEAMERSGAKNYQVVKGWFSDTLSSVAWNEPIAILRLDGDWYESTMVCLETLFPHVAKGGVIIVDDYYVWDGCSKAVHDYLSKYGRAERISQYRDSVCHLIKQ